MAGLQRELENALVARASLLLEAAQACLLSLNLSPDTRGLHPSYQLEVLRSAALQIQDAEALTATIFNRCGASWDVLAGVDVSKQAVHRRLAKLGELAYDRAQTESPSTEFSLAATASMIKTFMERTGVDHLNGAIADEAEEWVKARQSHRWW